MVQPIHVLYLFLSLAAFGLSALAGRLCSRTRWWPVFGFIALVPLFLEDVLMHYSEIEFAFFPWADYIFFRGWGYIGAFFVFGLAAGRVEGRNRRALNLFIVFLLLTRAFLWWQMLFGLDLDFKELGSKGGLCLQSTYYTCAPACCVTLLAKLGYETSQKEMARLCMTGKTTGTTDLQIMRGLMLKLDPARHHPRIKRISWEELSKIPLPAIASFYEGFLIGHAVVIAEFTGDTVLVGDPRGGFVRMTRKQFESFWKGRVFFIEKPD